VSCKPIEQMGWYPVHCAVCIQAGKSTPATWLVNRGPGTYSYHACDAHRAALEQHGTAALRRRRTGKAV
jgi:hypothetical protein